MRNLDDDQRCPPPASFLALHTDATGRRPSLPMAVLIERHDLCESLAVQLLLLAHNLMTQDGVALTDVLPRCRAVLSDPEIGLLAAEVPWILTRLAELTDQSRHQNSR